VPALYNVRDLMFRYDHAVTALNGATLRVEAGQRVALIGANGSGKSTLLRILDGLYFPQSGIVEFAGELLTETRFKEEKFQFAFRRRVGMVFQNPDVQLFNPTVFDEIAFGPLQLRWPRPQILERVARALELMGIADLRDRAPHRLSGGEKKRVAIASALVLEPDVLLLDEPTSALDPKSQSQVIDLLSSYYATGERTVVVATHDLNIIEDVADVCHVMESGQIVASGTPREILDNWELLETTGLIHAHRHKHGAVVHSHPHRHGHSNHQH
jgi:cobalt/nickel transport system ATP-binding protein